MRYLIFIVLIAITVSCTTNKQEKVSQLPDNWDPILTPYISIVDALVNDDFVKTRELGMQLQNSEATNGVELAFKSMGRLINEASSLYDQRAILEQMAIVMQLYIEQSIINDYYIYKFKCINEYDGKEVTWYALSKKSKNPFIGENSTDCVELVETIEPVIVK